MLAVCGKAFSSEIIRTGIVAVISTAITTKIIEIWHKTQKPVPDEVINQKVEDFFSIIPFVNKNNLESNISLIISGSVQIERILCIGASQANQALEIRNTLDKKINEKIRPLLPEDLISPNRISLKLSFLRELVRNNHPEAIKEKEQILKIINLTGFDNEQTSLNLRVEIPNRQASPEQQRPTFFSNLWVG